MYIPVVVIKFRQIQNFQNLYFWKRLGSNTNKSFGRQPFLHTGIWILKIQGAQFCHTRLKK